MAGLASTGVLVSAFAAAAPADDLATCSNAFSEGPALSKNGQLLAARAELTRCAAAPCPASMRALCAEDLHHLEERIPTVVFAATGARGEDLLEVRVVEDGKLLVSRLDGRSVELDPGPHTFHFQRDDGASVDVPIVLREGERARPVSVSIETPAASQPAPPLAMQTPAEGPPPARPLPWTALVSGGVTLVAAGSFGFFGIRGVAERSDLSGCKGSCSASSVDRVRTSYTIADVSLGLAVAALAVTAVLYATRPTSTTRVAASRAGLVVPF
jgi:hypothetical protein